MIKYGFTQTIILIVLIFNFCSAEIINVDPPSWWTHFNDRTLELMVYGESIGKTETVTVFDDNKEIETQIVIEAIKKTENPNYLFIELNLLNDLIPGQYTFKLDGKSEESFDFTFNAKEENRSYANGFNSSDAIYLLMPDRFSNGDTKNDFVKGLRAGTDRSIPGMRHGGDFQGIMNKLDYLKDLGVTAIWMTPVFINDMPEVAGGYGNQVYGAYHGYAATNFYKTDPRFGTNEKYKELIAQAHKKGLKVVMDIIHNHTGDKHWWMDDLPSSDWYNISNIHTNTNYETAVANDPYASKYDLKHLTDAPFVKEMPDLNQNNPLVDRYLIQLSYWWIEYSGIDGMRMDTYPYASKEPMARWAKSIISEFPNFNIVGEIWVTEPPLTAYWQTGFTSPDGYESHLPSVIDFPFSYQVGQALGRNSKPNDIKNIYYTLAQDFIYPNPKDNVIFLDNHDTDRFYSTVGKDIRKYKLGFALLMVNRGIPQMYYGFEINLYGSRKKGDADIRKDFPGGWLEDKRSAFIKNGRTNEENEIWEFCSRLLNWRKGNSTIHNGHTMQFIPLKDGIYSIFRYDEEKVIGLIINPSEEKVVIQSNRYDELTHGQKNYLDIVDGKIKKWENKINIPPVGFRLIEFKL